MGKKILVLAMLMLLLISQAWVGGKEEVRMSDMIHVVNLESSDAQELKDLSGQVVAALAAGRLAAIVDYETPAKGGR